MYQKMALGIDCIVLVYRLFGLYRKFVDGYGIDLFISIIPKTYLYKLLAAIGSM